MQAEALFFGIEELVSWIRGKGYPKNFTTVYEVEERVAPIPNGSGLGAIGMFQSTAKPNTEETFFPSRGTQVVYTCPRNTQGHDEHPERCGRQCQNAKRELEAAGGTCYTERGIARVFTVTKETVFRDMDV